MTADALNPPREVVDIARRLEEAGFETWCVGGAIRDALLGLEHLDWDLATAARPEQVRALFRRTVPVGIEFGTVGVLDRQGVMHEVTTFRRDVRTDGRHAVVEFGASLDEDLARRDFTINAIAYSPGQRQLRDPFGGRADLERGIVRAVGVAAERMREDRLRALRAIRFAARLGFTIDPATWAAIVESVPDLPRLSRERIQQELEKTMEQVARPSGALALWRGSGALRVLVPELDRQPNEALAAADAIPLPGLTGRPERRDARLDARLVALFLGLEPAAAREAAKGLKLSNAQVRRIAEMAARWPLVEERIGTSLLAPEPPRDVELRRWAAAIGRTDTGPLLRLAEARWAARRLAGGNAPAPERVASVYRRLLRVAYRDPVSLADLAVDGNDLIEAGFAPGPALAKILRALLEAVVEDPSINTRDALLDLARRLPLEG
jgi:tRNA nucleotidyltransferase (CCA-adding enzyme)